MAKTKTKTSFKEDFQKHPVVFSMVFVVLSIIALVILFMNIGSISTIWPTSTTINEKKLDLVKVQEELQVAMNELNEIQLDEESFINHNADFWITERDGNAKVNIQKRINGAAARHGVSLSSVGAVRADKISDGIFIMTTSIRGEGPLKSIIDFLGELQGVQPRFYWQSILLRPKNVKTLSNIMITGGIQVIAIEDERMTRLLIDKE